MNPQSEGEVSIHVNGRQYRGNYRVDDDKRLVHLESEYGSGSAPLRGPRADQVAALVLREIIERGGS